MDTIYAPASPPGSAARGILRLSGPEAFAAAARVLAVPPQERRAAALSSVAVLGYEVPCLVLSFPAPASYTGEDVVELHLPGSPLLLDEVAACFRPLARLATPGEFTRRAFENKRLDLAEAEAVLQLIHAAGEDERRFAVDVLRGGLASGVDAIRSHIQDALALLEAGLDFTDGETGEVDPAQWLPALDRAAARCAELLGGLPETAVHGEILLLGFTNAGKSSLANALAGEPVALVADEPGTTRDVIAIDLPSGVRLLDGPGDLEGPSDVDRLALALRDRLGERVAAALLVLDATDPRVPPTTLPILARVYTKLDLARVEPDRDGAPAFAVSAHTGEGIPELRDFLARSTSSGQTGLRARLHDEIACCSGHLASVQAAARDGVPAELLAVDLHDALGALDRIWGRSTPEDVLDRIFAGFCLGK